MKIEYDPTADALYVRLGEAGLRNRNKYSLA